MNYLWRFYFLIMLYCQVCELDIIFNFEKAYFMLDEFIIGGEVQETSKKNVLKAIAAQDLLQEVRICFCDKTFELSWGLQCCGSGRIRIFWWEPILKIKSIFYLDKKYVLKNLMISFLLSRIRIRIRSMRIRNTGFTGLDGERD